MNLHLAFMGIGLAEIILLSLVIIPVIVGLYLCATNKKMKPLEKAIWILVIWTIPILGFIAYWVNYEWRKSTQN
jgi:hypothetical protein